MRLPSQNSTILFAIVIFSAFITMIFYVVFKRMQESENVSRQLDSQCVERFQNWKVRNKLFHALTFDDLDEFMVTIKKYLPSCQLKKNYSSNSYGLIEATSNTQPLCPPQSPLLRGRIDVDITAHAAVTKMNGNYTIWPPTFEELATTYPNLQLGSYYSGPKDCKCRGHTAVIVPYRDREEHLRYFLYYIHDLLQRQQLCYIVIVSEQIDDHVFNKGQLMNTAFAFARKLMSFDCYIFHDVDMIAEDDRILYTCREDAVVHISPYLDKYHYKSHTDLSVGGVLGFTEHQFLTVNGFSNEYSGWGAEDDDMLERIWAKKIVVWKSEKDYTRFQMIKHIKDPGNPINQQRLSRLKEARKRQDVDGINNLDTLLVKSIMYKTHTLLKVKIYLAKKIN